MFAHDNARVNYLKLALINAILIKKNMGCDVAIITDSAALERSFYLENKHVFDQYVDQLIVAELEAGRENRRVYRDTSAFSFTDNFLNQNRLSALDLSPFDETLLLDVDYLMLSSTLSGVWGSAENILINKDAVGLDHLPLDGPEHRLNPYGIRMYWATAIYFRKSEAARLLFELVKHIQEHWDFYQQRYEFSGAIFRNDFAFAIAIHILSGFNENAGPKPLPDPTILTAIDKDQFVELLNCQEAKLLANDRKESQRFLATKIKNVNVHCMNKLSLLRNADHILEALRRD
jgi:hypothetical protein